MEINKDDGRAFADFLAYLLAFLSLLCLLVLLQWLPQYQLGFISNVNVCVFVYSRPFPYHISYVFPDHARHVELFAGSGLSFATLQRHIEIFGLP